MPLRRLAACAVLATVLLAAAAQTAPPPPSEGASSSLGLELPTVEAPGAAGVSGNGEASVPEGRMRFVLAVERPEVAAADAERALQLMSTVLQLPTPIPLERGALEGEIVQLRFKDEATEDAAAARLAATGTGWTLDRRAEESQIDAVQIGPAMDARVDAALDGWVRVFRYGSEAEAEPVLTGGKLDGNRLYMDVPQDPEQGEMLAGAVLSFPDPLRLEALSPRPLADLEAGAEDGSVLLADRAEPDKAWESRGIWADAVDARQVELAPQPDGTTRMTVRLDPLAAWILRENARQYPDVLLGFTYYGEVLARGTARDLVQQDGFTVQVTVREEEADVLPPALLTAGLPPITLVDRLNALPFADEEQGAAETVE